jgi:integrase
MARQAKPWFWRARNGWYVTIGGVRHHLADGRSNKKAAMTAFHRLAGEDPEARPDNRASAKAAAASAPPSPPAPADGQAAVPSETASPASLPSTTTKRRKTVLEICDEFLIWMKDRRPEKTRTFYRGFLEDFCRVDRDPEHTFWNAWADELAPHHLDRWFECHDSEGFGKIPDGKGGLRKWRFRKWGPTTRNSAARCVQRAFNWAVKRGHLTGNPLARMEKDVCEERRRPWTDEEWTRLLAAIEDGEFRDLLLCIRLCGTRPSEMSRLTAAHVQETDDGPVVVYRDHKTSRKTKQPRIIFLPPEAAAIIRRRSAARPTGPLFRTRNGSPWLKDRISQKLRRLRKRLGLPDDVVAYGLRHTFVTQSVPKVGVATTAKLVGHASLRMVERYTHLEALKGHLRQAADRAAEGVTLPPTASEASEASEASADEAAAEQARAKSKKAKKKPRESEPTD